MAWQDILGNADVKSALVVAHNAVNQALLNTALDLPPSFFRRLLQSNAATSVIDFQPNGDKPPTRTIDRMNQVGTDRSIHKYCVFYVKALSLLCSVQIDAPMHGNMTMKGLPIHRA